MIRNEQSPFVLLPINVRGKILSFISSPQEQIVLICDESLRGKASTETKTYHIESIESIRKEIFNYYISECFHNYFNRFLNNSITKILFSRILEKIRLDVTEIWEEFHAMRLTFEEKKRVCKLTREDFDPTTANLQCRHKLEETNKKYLDYQRENIDILYKLILFVRKKESPPLANRVKIYSPKELQELIPDNLRQEEPHILLNSVLITAVSKGDPLFVQKVIGGFPYEIQYLQIGYNAMQFAIKQKKWDIVEVILSSNISKIIPRFEQAIIAVQLNKPELLDALLNPKAFSSLFNLFHFEEIVISFLNAHFTFYEKDLLTFHRERNPLRLSFFSPNDPSVIRFQTSWMLDYLPSKEVMIAHLQSALILAIRQKKPHLVKPFLQPHIKSLKNFITAELRNQIIRTFYSKETIS